VQAALNSITALNGNVSVTGAVGGPYTVRFINALRGVDAALLTFTNVTGAAQNTLVAETLTGGDLPFNATAAQVQTALQALPNIGAGNVSVAGNAGDHTPSPSKGH